MLTRAGMLVRRNTQAVVSTSRLFASEGVNSNTKFPIESKQDTDEISDNSKQNIEDSLSNLQLECNGIGCTHGTGCTHHTINVLNDESTPPISDNTQNTEPIQGVIQGSLFKNDISSMLKSTNVDLIDLALDQSRSRGTSELIWDKPVDQFQQIFLNNQRWVQSCLQEDSEFFSKLAVGQKPQFLLIGCSDSRVPAQEIMGMKAGELFVHRNIANLVVNSDINLLSVLDYSINFLDIKDIIVLGHYGCGGVQAALTKQDHGLVSHWLRNIRDVHRLHQDELLGIRDEKRRLHRMVELNVMEQCINLFGNSIVQKAQSTKGYPRIHGMVYDIANGYLRELDIDFRPLLKKYRDIYSVYSFKKKSDV